MPSWSGCIGPYVKIEESLGQGTELIKIQDSFDYIHFRNVAQGITRWPEVLAEAYRCMRPGAYVELAEYDSKLLQSVAIPPSPS
jgi:ubiquinone/menaquinone biosynthesis C-methylase UbiE